MQNRDTNRLYNTFRPFFKFPFLYRRHIRLQAVNLLCIKNNAAQRNRFFQLNLNFIAIFIKGFSYGVDFTGGRTYVVRFDQDVTAEDIREAVLDEFQAEHRDRQDRGHQAV